jgi:hypothetical protein
MNIQILFFLILQAYGVSSPYSCNVRVDTGESKFSRFGAVAPGARRPDQIVWFDLVSGL